MFKQVISFLAFPELIYTILIFTSLLALICITVFKKIRRNPFTVTRRDIFFASLLILILLTIFFSLPMPYPSVHNGPAQLWSYFEQARRLSDSDISFKDKMEMVPSTHDSHPAGYGFLIFLFVNVVGYYKYVKYLSLILFILTLLLAYVLIKRELKSSLLSFITSLLLLIIPPFIWTLIVSQPETLAIPLIILIAYLSHRLIKDNELENNRLIFITFLLSLLAICYTKYEFAPILLILPFVIIKSNIRREKVFLFIALAVFCLLLTPVIYHTSFFGFTSLNEFSLSNFLEHLKVADPIRATLIVMIMSISLIFALIKRDMTFLFPSVFSILFFSFNNSTLYDLRYISSLQISFSYVCWRLVLDYSSLKGKTKNLLWIAIIIIFTLNIISCTEQMIKEHHSQQHYSLSFFNSLSNCTYYSHQEGSKIRILEMGYLYLSSNLIKEELDPQELLCGKNVEELREEDIPHILEEYPWQIVILGPTADINKIIEISKRGQINCEVLQNRPFTIINLSKKAIPNPPR